MTDDIKMPAPKFLYDEEMGELHDPGDYAPSDCAALYTADQVREAVRLNAQAVPCDCTTEIHADGTRKTWCGSDQMRRASEEGHAFAAAPQPAQQPLLAEKDALLRQALEPDLEDHEYELWGQNVKADFVTVEKAIAYAREAVRLNAQSVPDGWVLVPVEPTLEMLEAGTYKIGVRDCYRAMLSAAPAAPQPAQPLTVPDAQEKDLLQAIQERDAADDYIDALLDEVLGTDRPEWYSAYGHADAMEQVRERMNTLMKPSIDKAWDRFQSSAAPQPAQPPLTAPPKDRNAP